MRPYLCGPINGCTDFEANDWRDVALKQWPDAINPMVRDYRSREEVAYREIVDLDKRDVRACDVVIANCPKPSVGTSMEVFYAWTIGRPVIAWVPPHTAVSPWLRYHASAIVRSWENVAAAVERFRMSTPAQRHGREMTESEWHEGR